MRERRRALNPDQRTQAAHALAESLVSVNEFRDAGHVAVYMPMDGELDPVQVVARARAGGKQLYLPVLIGDDGMLGFAPWQPDTPLYPNRFNIPEPRLPADSLRRPESLDLVLTPLVAFDRRGHRLGMGGGYYDRSFAFLRSGAGKPLLIGLAYEFQCLASLSAENWDIPLAGVATERGFYRFPA